MLFTSALRIFIGVGTTNTNHPSSGYQEHITGSSLGVQFPSWLGIHSLAWGYDWRQVYGFSSNVPMSIREEAGHSLKSSIKVSGCDLTSDFKLARFERHVEMFTISYPCTLSLTHVHTHTHTHKSTNTHKKTSTLLKWTREMIPYSLTVGTGPR